MRGKDQRYPVKLLPDGITPAYAGKSLLELVAVVGGRDHPRLCGEKTAICTNKTEIKGSPPPMRGKATCTLVNNDIIGITPAYAGKRIH